MSPWFEALLRWTHVVAGLLWVGQAYFLTFVEAQVARAGNVDASRTLPGETRLRALNWARWGAVYTWISGLLLVGAVYYSTLDQLVRREIRFTFKYGLTTEFTLATNEPVVSQATGVLISLALIGAAFLVYEALWKLLRRFERVAAAASLAVFAVALFLLGRVFTGRAVFIHAGAILGTIMAMNVWTRIWPAQKKAVQVARGLAPTLETSVSALAAQRSKHNAYLSVPVLFAMISNHYPAIYDQRHGWAIMVAVVLVGWAIAWWLYGRSSRAAPARYGAPAGISPSTAHAADAKA